MNRILCVLTMLACVAASTAVADVIRFHVNGDVVAELYNDTLPSARPIKLAGRSGQQGTNERSGLYDNVLIHVDGGAAICDDTFNALNTNYWGLYGQPEPHLLTDFGQPAPCLMTSGDSWNDSGLYSLETYDWSNGFVFGVDVHVNSTSDYHNVEFGIADRDVPVDEQFGHVIGVTWKNSSTGQNVLRCVTDVASIDVPAPPIGEWYRIRISSDSVSPTIPIYFFVDGGIVAELESFQQPQSRPIKLVGRSGQQGTNERSGLYDNVFAIANGGATVCEDQFVSLDMGYWGLYGSPEPHLLLDFGVPEPCLMTSGDSWNDSGLYSLDTYDWSSGFQIQVQGHVSSLENFHNVEFGIADRDVPVDEQFGHVIGVTWKNNSVGENVLQCLTDIDYAEVPAPALGTWHTIVVGTYDPPLEPPWSPVRESSWGAIKALFK